MHGSDIQFVSNIEPFLGGKRYYPGSGDDILLMHILASISSNTVTSILRSLRGSHKRFPVVKRIGF